MTIMKKIFETKQNPCFNKETPYLNEKQNCELFCFPLYSNEERERTNFFVIKKQRNNLPSILTFSNDLGHMNDLYLYNRLRVDSRVTI